jgi:hypothetical protein
VAMTGQASHNKKLLFEWVDSRPEPELNITHSGNLSGSHKKIQMITTIWI